MEEGQSDPAESFRSAKQCKVFVPSSELAQFSLLALIRITCGRMPKGEAACNSSKPTILAVIILVIAAGITVMFTKIFVNGR